MLENSWYKKENPFLGLTGMGGGVGSNLVLFGGDTGEPIEVANSLRFNSEDTATLERTPSSAGNRRTWTWSGWVKRTNPGSRDEVFTVWNSDTDSEVWCVEFFTDDTLQLTQISYTMRITNQVFRDPSAWLHIVCAVDTTISSPNEDDRVKLYINGSQVINFSTKANPSHNSDTAINGTYLHRTGVYVRNGTGYGYFDGYMADIHMVDGLQLDASSFGMTHATTGQWVPKDCSGDLTYGTNGFYLKFDNTSDLGEDSAGSNDWTANNFSTSAGAGNDVLADSPTAYDDGGNGVGNYCTWNPLAAHSDIIFKQGNLEAHGPTAGSTRVFGATVGVNTGKWYWECEPTRTGNNNGGQTVGIALPSFGFTETTTPGDNSLSWAINGNDGNFRHNNSVVRTDYCLVGGAQDQKVLTTGNICMCALDMDNGKFWMGINNTWGSTSGGVGNPATGANAVVTSGLAGNTLIPAGTTGTDSGANNLRANFGQRAFAYTPPTGYKALNVFNLSEPTITDPSKHFDVATDTGANILSAATGLTDGADFVWIKDRDNSDDHILFNRINDTGMDGTPHLRSNEVDSEATCGTYSAPSGNSVSWVWNAGTTTDTNNTDGSSTPTGVRANPTAGFSIIKYTGTGASASWGHGLGKEPELIITKDLDGTNYWNVYHKDVGYSKYLRLDSTAGEATPGATRIGATSSTTFTTGSAAGETNASGTDYIAYCWTSVEGYSRISSYTGNNSAAGPFVYCGFKPRWIMLRAINSTADWIVWDTARDTYNVAESLLYANLSGAEDEGIADRSPDVIIDVLSNGFKCRGTNNDLNASEDYLYCAFAESPFKYSNAR